MIIAKAKPQFKCKGCGELFNTEEDIRYHYYNCQYEFYFDKRGDLYKCRLCDESFSTYLDYVNHFLSSSWHENYAYTKELTKFERHKEKNNWIIRPIHQKLIDKHIREDKNKKALKYDTDKTNFLWTEIEHSFKYSEYNVIELVGEPGTGKSVDALAIARKLQLFSKRYYNRIGNIFISRGLDETQNFMVKAKKGDIIIQDEDPDAVGEGANWYKSNIENLLKTMRVTCISFIFVSPRRISYLHNKNFILESVFRDFKKRRNKLALYDGDGRAIGWVEIDILSVDDPLMIRYDKKKFEIVDNLKSEGGSFSIRKSEEKLNKDVQKIYDIAIKNGLNKKVDFNGLVDMVTGPTKYQATIAKLAYKKYEATRVVEDDNEPKEIAKDIMFMSEKYLDLDVTFFDDIISLARKTLSDELLLGAETFYLLYKDKLEIEDIAIKLKHDRGELESALNLYTNSANGQGPIVEKLIYDRYLKNWKHMGGQNEPDAKRGNLIAEIKMRSGKHRKTHSILKKDCKYIKDYPGYKLYMYLIEYGHKGQVYDIRGRLLIYSIS